jgi:hypothetical protein
MRWTDTKESSTCPNCENHGISPQQKELIENSALKTLSLKIKIIKEMDIEKFESLVNQALADDWKRDQLLYRAPWLIQVLTKY